MTEEQTADRTQGERGTAGVDESVELAVLERSGFVESRHIGSAVVLDATGEAALSVGSPQTSTSNWQLNSRQN